MENFLFDAQLYSSLLCKDHEACVRIAYEARPKNVHRCFDPDGTRYYVTGNSQQRVPAGRNRQRWLVVDTSLAIAEAQRRLDGATQSVTREGEKFATIKQGFLRAGRTPEQRHSALEKERTGLQVSSGQEGLKIVELAQKLAEEDDDDVSPTDLALGTRIELLLL